MRLTPGQAMCYGLAAMHAPNDAPTGLLHSSPLAELGAGVVVGIIIILPPAGGVLD